MMSRRFGAYNEHGFQEFPRTGYSTMIHVMVFTKQNGIGTEAGSIDFHGVKVSQPDGSTKIETDRSGRPIGAQAHPHFPESFGGESVDEIVQRIGERLAIGQICGQVGEFSWNVESNHGGAKS
jgi:hypothetical protein